MACSGLQRGKQEAGRQLVDWAEGHDDTAFWQGCWEVATSKDAGGGAKLGMGVTRLLLVQGPARPSTGSAHACAASGVFCLKKQPFLLLHAGHLTSAFHKLARAGPQHERGQQEKFGEHGLLDAELSESMQNHTRNKTLSVK